MGPAKTVTALVVSVLLTATVVGILIVLYLAKGLIVLADRYGPASGSRHG